MQALTSAEEDEPKKLIQTILNTDAVMGYMHKGFNYNNPKEFTREWFGWANSLFALLLLEKGR